MIEMSLMQMAHPEFNQVIQTIWNTPHLNAQTSYSAHRLREKLIKVNKEINDLRKSLLEKYGKKDESGKLVVNEQGFVAFDTPEQGAAFEKEFQDVFSAKVVKLNVSKLNFADIAQVKGISAAQWSHLAPLVDNFPEEEKDEESDSASAEPPPPTP